MDITTLARVRTYLGLDSQNVANDALLNTLITAWSAAIELYLDRAFLAGSYSENLDVEPGQTDFWVKNWPVTAIADVRNDLLRTFAAASIVASTSYGFYADEDGAGRIFFDRFRPIYGRQVLQVNYTGGMAASTTAFITAYPELAQCCDMQVAYMYSRKDQIGLLNVSGTGGSVTVPGQHTRGAIPPHESFIPEVRQILDQWSRMGVGL